MNQFTNTNILIFILLFILALVNPLIAVGVIIIFYAATLYDAINNYKLLQKQLKLGSGKIRMQYSKVSEPSALIFGFYWIPPFIIELVYNNLKGNNWFFSGLILSYVMFAVAFFIMRKRNNIADSSLL